MGNPFRSLRSLAGEGRRAWPLCANWRSFARVVSDLVGYRLRRIVGRPFDNQERTISLRDGTVLTYRNNPGDIWSLREVWLYEGYRLPFDLPGATRLVDLGANIGLTSVWFARRFGGASVLDVEPSPANAALARRNLAANGIPGEVVEAAVGPEDGTARFHDDAASNIGCVIAEGGREVPMVSMETLLDRWLPDGEMIDLVKVDIEGSEQALLTGDLAWLSRVRALVFEFHQGLVDYEDVTARVAAAGFRFIRNNTMWPGQTDAFVRDAGSSVRA